MGDGMTLRCLTVWRLRSVLSRAHGKRVWHYRCPTAKPHIILKVAR